MIRMRFNGFLVLLVVFISLSSCSFPLFRSQARRTEIKMAGHSRRFRESWKVRKAKHQQESRQAKLKKDYERSVTKSRKRTYEIQTPEVQDRMRKNAESVHNREKKKNKKDAISKKASKKYN